MDISTSFWLAVCLVIGTYNLIIGIKEEDGLSLLIGILSLIVGITSLLSIL